MTKHGKILTAGGGHQILDRTVVPPNQRNYDKIFRQQANVKAKGGTDEPRILESLEFGPLASGRNSYHCGASLYIRSHWGGGPRRRGLRLQRSLPACPSRCGRSIQADRAALAAGSSA